LGWPRGGPCAPPLFPPHHQSPTKGTRQGLMEPVALLGDGPGGAVGSGALPSRRRWRLWRRRVAVPRGRHPAGSRCRTRPRHPQPRCQCQRPTTCTSHAHAHTNSHALAHAVSFCCVAAPRALAASWGVASTRNRPTGSPLGGRSRARGLTGGPSAPHPWPAPWRAGISLVWWRTGSQTCCWRA
jgi:hypothetical protein